MKCMDCHQGRKFAEGSVYCRIYGMIIREDHECTRDGWKIHDEEEREQGNDKEAVLDGDGRDHRGDGRDRVDDGEGRAEADLGHGAPDGEHGDQLGADMARGSLG